MQSPAHCWPSQLRAAWASPCAAPVTKATTRASGAIEGVTLDGNAQADGAKATVCHTRSLSTCVCVLVFVCWPPRVFVSLCLETGYLGLHLWDRKSRPKANFWGGQICLFREAGQEPVGGTWQHPSSSNSHDCEAVVAQQGTARLRGVPQNGGHGN